MAVPPVSIDDFALATVTTRPDEAGGPPPQVLRATGQPLWPCAFLTGRCLAYRWSYPVYAQLRIAGSTPLSALGFAGLGICGAQGSTPPFRDCSPAPSRPRSELAVLT